MGFSPCGSHPDISSQLPDGTFSAIFAAVARLARVIAVDVPHHVTQRGNARQYILASDADRTVYLSLLREYAVHHELLVMGYCLMSNHIHLIAIPQHGTVAGALECFGVASLFGGGGDGIGVGRHPTVHAHGEVPANA